jgi:hypothetical protein
MKVRIKELAQESKFIRKEENKVKSKKEYLYEKFPKMETSVGVLYGDLCNDQAKLASHRKYEVRNAARAAQLAYAFLRGIPYLTVEGKRKQEKEYLFNANIKPEIKRLVKKFGNLYTYNSENYDAEVDKWLDIH